MVTTNLLQTMNYVTCQGKWKRTSQLFDSLLWGAQMAFWWKEGSRLAIGGRPLWSHWNRSLLVNRRAGSHMLRYQHKNHCSSFSSSIPSIWDLSPAHCRRCPLWISLPTSAVVNGGLALICPFHVLVRLLILPRLHK